MADPDPYADLAFFTAGTDLGTGTEAGADTLVPTGLAASSWSSRQMHGVAIGGALGRAAERCLVAIGRTDLRPARSAVDLFRPATMTPCTLTAEVVREGRRLCLVDVTLLQDGEAGLEPVARAGITFLLPTETTSGSVWTPAERPGPPPADAAPAPAPGTRPAPHPPYLRSAGDWSQDRTAHQNDAHKTSWNSLPSVVAGEPATPFQAVCALADASNLVVNWGTRGVEYINTDSTLLLARPPVSTEIGLAAVDRVEADGIAVGTAAVFDRAGPLGTVTLTALANARRAVIPRDLMAE